MHTNKCQRLLQYGYVSVYTESANIFLGNEKRNIICSFYYENRSRLMIYFYKKSKSKISENL